MLWVAHATTHQQLQQSADHQAVTYTYEPMWCFTIGAICYRALLCLLCVVIGGGQSFGFTLILKNQAEGHTVPHTIPHTTFAVMLQGCGCKGQG
jgi:hypothetical protein